jgi:single-strand DNA-binding protein
MASFNKVILLGNLTKDPELRMTPKGTAVCQFGIAVNRRYRDDSGQDREETTFVDIDAWGKQAETIAKYCTKGRPLFIEGRLRLDSWEDKNTKEKRSKMKVVLENFQFVGGQGGGAAAEGGEGEAPQRSYTPRPQAAPPTPPPARPAAAQEAPSDEDVPF